MHQLRIELSEGERREWHWKLFGRNGENLSPQEGFTRKHDAMRGFEDHADAVLIVMAQDGKLKAAIERLGIDLNLS